MTIRKIKYCSLFFGILFSLTSNAQTQQAVQDDFEGNGTITSWAGDDCNFNTSLANPYQQGTNMSNTVFEYHDIGGSYANVRFDVPNNFDLSANHTFSFQLYVPSNGLTGNQTNKVSFKLQDGTEGAPWATQSEIIKTIVLDQWQTMTFDFENDNYSNLDPTSLAPIQRTDFNRVLIQINGENNNDHVLAYIDDFTYDGTVLGAIDYNVLIWSDEFDVDGAIDASKWHHQTQLPSGGSWYNGEIQHYTNRTDNSIVDNGILKITAKKETFTDQGQTKQYTSARLNSKFAFKYGKVEIRAKMPTGVGTWPALWMLGKNINEDGGYWDIQGLGTTSWPACGEMDIIEHWGGNQNYVQSATHTPSSHGATVNHGGQSIPTTSTDFHVYALEWTADKLVFSVDGAPHFSYDPAVKDASTWPFDAEQYFLFNIAIEPSIDPNFTESSMEVDYIRVYQSSPVSTNQVNRNEPVSYFPNPIRDELNIVLEETKAQDVNVQIFSVDGKLVKTQNTNIEGNKVSVKNLETLPKGLYIVSFQTNDKNYNFKIVK